jgi:hypothetical protein
VHRESAVSTPTRGREITPAREQSVAVLPKMKTVHFHSLPNAATVLINGKMVGKTPVTVQLHMGSHNILVEKISYISINYRLNVDQGGESNLYHDLHLDTSH